MSGTLEGTRDPSNPFVEWVLGELTERGWNREDLRKAAGIGRSSGINNVLSRTKALGPDLARDIARGLGVKQRVVFIMARLIDDEDIGDAKEEYEMDEIQKMLSRITNPTERERIRRIIRSIVRETARHGN